MYDALQQKPDADMVLPVAFETVTEQQFLGRRVNFTVKNKHIRLKINSQKQTKLAPTKITW